MASIELTARIGEVQNLSLGTTPPVPKHTQRLTAGERTKRYDHLQPQVNMSTLPAKAANPKANANANNPNFAEFGQPSNLKDTKASTLPIQQHTRDDYPGHGKSREKERAEKNRPATAGNNSSDSTNSVNAHPARLTVMNQTTNDRNDGDGSRNSWFTATEEKLRLKQLDAKNTPGVTPVNS